MISVRVSNNSKRKTIVVNGSTTIKDCFAKADISPAGATISLDGDVIRDLNKTLDELGVTESAALMACIKMDNNI